MTIILVSGALANKYDNGGAAWARLSWVLGLRKLGITVYFVEQIGRASCVDSSGAVTPFEQSVNRAYFQQIMEQYGLAHAAALIYENGEQSVGGDHWRSPNRQ